MDRPAQHKAEQKKAGEGGGGDQGQPDQDVVMSPVADFVCENADDFLGMILVALQQSVIEDNPTAGTEASEIGVGVAALARGVHDQYLPHRHVGLVRQFAYLVFQILLDAKV